LEKSTSTAPHPILTDYYADRAQRPNFLRGLFDHTAHHYDHINKTLSLGSGAWYRKRALLQAGLRAGMQVLDVATGTGLIARQVADIVGHKGVIGLDVSSGMLVEARRTLNIGLIQALAEQLPIADERFDFLSMGYALRHVDDLDTTFGEFQRVLRPNGTLLILEIGKPTTRMGQIVASLYLGKIIPFISRWTSGKKEAQTLMRYYWDTIERCVPPQTILQALTNAGFTEVRCDMEFNILRAYTGHTRGDKPCPSE